MGPQGTATPAVGQLPLHTVPCDAQIPPPDAILLGEGGERRMLERQHLPKSDWATSKVVSGYLYAASLRSVIYPSSITPISPSEEMELSEQESNRYRKEERCIFLTFEYN